MSKHGYDLNERAPQGLLRLLRPPQLTGTNDFATTKMMASVSSEVGMVSEVESIFLDGNKQN